MVYNNICVRVDVILGIIVFFMIWFFLKYVNLDSCFLVCCGLGGGVEVWGVWYLVVGVE